MKAFLDFFPILLFFLAYKFGDIFIATGVAILASLIQLLWLRFTTGAFQKLPLITFISLLILGGATLLLRDEQFIKWKPTVVYWVLSVAFLGSHFIGQKPLFQRMIEASITLPKRIWRQLNVSWVIFFALMGGANLFVAYHFDTNTWVNFKLFGTMGITFVFILIQGIYMSRFHSEPQG